MIICKDNLKLSPKTAHEESLPNLSSSFDDVRNLSEIYLYSEKLPTELVFHFYVEDVLAGQISLKSIRWFNRKAELMFFLKEAFRGQGFGSKMLEMILEHVFKTMNFHRLEAEVYDYNIAAQHLLQKAGFTEEGRLREAKFFQGKYHDILCYGLLGREYVKSKR